MLREGKEVNMGKNPMNDDSVKILAKGFSFCYGPKRALNGLSLSIKKNSLLVVMGPTGSGKTTFLRSLNRLNDRVTGTRHEGQLLIDGVDVYSKHVDVLELRRRVGMVFALPMSLPMTIYDNVAYGPQKRGIRSKKKLDEIVETALRNAVIFDEVKDRLDTPAQKLSGGQQQRLSIARVLAMEPEIILLDEPTSGLDPISTLKIEELLWTLKERYTIILVTHNPVQAARLQSHIAFLYLGDLVEEGSAQDIFTRPKNKKTEDYITGKFG